MVDPRIADEVDAAVAGDVVEGESLEVEFTVVKISDGECSRVAHVLAPLKGDIESSS